MLYKRINKLILLIPVLLILFITVPSCITAAKNLTDLESNSIDSIEEDNIYSENELKTSSNTDTNFDINHDNELKTSSSDDNYYFDINAENDNGEGTKDNPYKNLKDNRIFDNTNIHLANGEYQYEQINSHSNIQIYGEDATKTIINGNGGTLTIKENFILRDVTLYNITIINQANLQAYNTIFSSSTSIYSGKTYGGAIYSTNNDIYLNNCIFKNCYAQYGGAIYLNDGNLEIIDCQFQNNSAYNYGGAIAFEKLGGNTPNINIQRTKFINDVSINNAGGAIYLKDTYFNANDVNFISCNATFGGAIALLKTNTQLYNVNLNNNTAKYEGGAIYQIYGNLNIDSSLLSNNNAKNGGAIYSIFSENTKINSNEFNSNYASLCGGAIYSFANTNNEILNNNYYKNRASSYNDSYETSIGITSIYSGNYTLFHTNTSYIEIMPQKYDLRDYGYVSHVKNQEDGGNCWAFYSIGSLESEIIKASGEILDLSEENMKNLISLYSPYGWNMETNKGGYTDMAIGYLVSWLGPVYETEDQYNDKNVLSPLINSLTHIQNIKFLKRNNFTDNDAIKEAILKYGAVATEIYYESTYLNYNNAYYYNGQNKANHGVTIIGWDDNYSKYKFKNTPAGDGAWIIENSWGLDWGNKGYMYVSYYDTELGEIGKEDATYVFILNDTIKYDKNYQYDIPGKTDYFLNSTNMAWYKNIFNSTDNEYLAAVSTYFQKDTNWTLTIKVNNILKYTQEGFSNAGYYTINLNQMIPLNIGDIFEVIFKITVDKEAGIPISEKIRFNNLFYKENISFLSNDGNTWTDFYQLNWTYPDHIYNSQVACIKSFTILNPIETTIHLDITNRTYTNANLIATVYNQYGFLVNSGNVTFKIGDIEYRTPLINGYAKLNITLDNNIIPISAEFKAIGYNASNVYKLISNPLVDTKLNLTISNSNHNPVNITTYITDLENNPVTSGFVTINTGVRNYTVGVTNGFANLTNIILNIGENSISAKYQDLFYYNSSMNTTSITISLINSKIELIINSIENPIEIIAKVSDLNNTPINSGFVNFKLSGKEYSVKVIDGVSKITHLFTKIGINNILATYTDNNLIYDISTNNTEIDVSKKEIELSFDVKTKENEVIISLSIPDCLMEYEISAQVNGATHHRYSKNGKVTLDLKDLEDGNYKYTISLISSIYNAKELIGEFNVKQIKTNIIAYDATICKNGEYSITLKDRYGFPATNRAVFLYIDGKYYRSKTNNQGIAVFKLNLNINTYPATIKFLGDDDYIESNLNTYISIKNSIILPSNTKYTLNSKYEATLLNTQGNPLVNELITVTLNGVTTNLKTNNEGKISLNINLKKGTYLIIINNPATGDMITQTITVVPRILKNKGITMYYNSGAKYQVRLYNNYGKPVGAGQTVTFKIKNKKYYVKTDKKGYAKLKITLKPGQYTIYATYKGYTVSNKIIVKSRLVTKNLVVKKGKRIKVKAKLLNKKGKILKGKKLKFKFKGKTYKVKTNKKGIATLKISKRISKKLKKGKKYKITISYGKMKVTNTIKIKK